MKRLLATIIVAWIGIASARAEEWSFLEHPALADHEIDITFEDAIAIAGRTGRDSCSVYEEHARDAYLNRYPDFRNFAQREDMRERWLESALQHMDSFCPLRNLRRGLIVPLEDRDPSGPIFYCGNVSREPRTVHEAHAIRSYLFLLKLAESNYSSAIETLLNPWDMPPIIRMDRRFRHYLLTVLQKDPDSSYGSLEISWFESRQMLSPEERKLVETAALRGDLAAVLRILPECKGE